MLEKGVEGGCPLHPLLQTYLLTDESVTGDRYDRQEKQQRTEIRFCTKFVVRSDFTAHPDITTKFSLAEPFIDKSALVTLLLSDMGGGRRSQG